MQKVFHWLNEQATNKKWNIQFDQEQPKPLSTNEEQRIKTISI